MHQHSLFTMDQLTNKEIFSILHEAQSFENEYQDWQLPVQSARVANLFFEPSTRTHFSFESAQMQLGCQIVDFQAESSSIAKGETLYDTIKTFEAIGYQCLVIRHPKDQYFKELDSIHIPILNAGDGAGNHPSQCLLDLLTIYQEFGKLSGLKIAIVGDIIHSRVASSNYSTLIRLGNEVVFSGPQEWQREDSPIMDLDKAVEWADVVMLLRIQKERGAGLKTISNRQYLHQYGLTKERYARMPKHAIICHPAPVNRGVEIDSELVESDKSRIFKQMKNGVLIRKVLTKRAFGIEGF